MQITITTIVILAALGYAAWRVYQALNTNGDPCYGCGLKKNCQKFGSSK